MADGKKANAGSTRTIVALWRDIEGWASSHPIAWAIVVALVASLLSPLAYLKGLEANLSNAVAKSELSKEYASKKELSDSQDASARLIDSERRQSGKDSLSVLNTLDPSGELERRAVSVQIYEVQGDEHVSTLTAVTNQQAQPPLHVEQRQYKTLGRDSKLTSTEAKLLILGPAISQFLGCELIALVGHFPGLVGVAIDTRGAGGFEVTVAVPKDAWAGECAAVEGVTQLCQKVSSAGRGAPLGLLVSGLPNACARSAAH